MDDLGDVARPPAPDTPADTEPETQFFAFNALRRALFALVLKNLCLTLVTVGIYRFWATTRLRQFYWSHVRMAGEPFEYLGTGKELLIGFLIALAVLVPAGLMFQLISLALETAASVWLAVANAVFLAGLYVLAQYASYRARRYRLTRTSWRSVRFGLDGSAWAFTGRVIAWTAASIATLGIAYPWARVALARYWMSHARFGDGRFRFEGSGRDLVAPWLIVLGFGFLPLIAFVLLNSGLVAEWMDETARDGTASVPLVGTSYPVLLLSMVLLSFLFVWYRVREFRYVVGRLEFGESRFVSDLRLSRILLLFVGYAVLLVLTMVFVAFFLLTVFHVVSSQFPTAGPFVASVIGALAFLTVFRILQEIILNFGLVRNVCRALTVSQTEPFEAVVQTSERGPSHGEGLADALDVDIGAF